MKVINLYQICNYHQFLVKGQIIRFHKALHRNSGDILKNVSIQVFSLQMECRPKNHCNSVLKIQGKYSKQKFIHTKMELLLITNVG